VFAGKAWPFGSKVWQGLIGARVPQIKLHMVGLVEE